MRSRVLMFAIGAILGGLAGCASAPPVHYYTLLAPAAGLPDPPGVPAPFAIELLPVGVPEFLDQPQLVVRRSATELQVLENERWAGPLSEELRAALSAGLAAELGVRDGAGLPSTAGGPPVLRIKLQLRRFDAWPGEQVQLEADWSIGQTAGGSGTGTSARLNCHSLLSRQAAGGYAEMVASQQQLVADLSAQISGAARHWQRTPVCPAG